MPFFPEVLPPLMLMGGHSLLTEPEGGSSTLTSCNAITASWFGN